MSLYSSRVLTSDRILFNSGVYFNGNSRIEVPYNPILDTLQEFTICAVVKFHNVSKYQGIVVRNFRFPYGFHVTDQNRYQVGLTFNDGSYVYTSSDLVVEYNVWQYVGVSFRASDGQVIFFKDSEFDYVSVAALPLREYNYPLQIGARTSTGKDALNGIIATVCLYSRFFSEADFVEWYNNPFNPSVNDLILWFLFTSGVGNECIDKASGLTGYMYGSTWVVDKTVKRLLTPVR